jgi:hypothetical protein
MFEHTNHVMCFWVPNLESYHPPYPASNIFPFVLYAKQVTVTAQYKAYISMYNNNYLSAAADAY